MHDIIAKMRFSHLPVIFLILLGLAIAACAPTPQPAIETPSPEVVVPEHAALTPFYSATPTPTPTATATLTPTFTPTPTATPVTHTVVEGETMISIAKQYGVTLDDLKAANPEVDPSVLPVGTVLMIPEPDMGVSLPEVTPTVVEPVVLGNVNCVRDAEGGAWCFAKVFNRLEDTAVEGVVVQVRLSNAAADENQEQMISPPLNLLKPGDWLPLAVYFHAPLPERLKLEMSVLSAYPLSQQDERYLPLKVRNLRVEMGEDRLSAEVSGDIELTGEGEAAASSIWVLAVALDEQGQVIGLRRWESYQTLPRGEMLPFAIRVYASKAALTKVEVFVEAQ